MRAMTDDERLDRLQRDWVCTDCGAKWPAKEHVEVCPSCHLSTVLLPHDRLTVPSIWRQIFWGAALLFLALAFVKGWLP